jgi:hypothetical protein
LRYHRCTGSERQADRSTGQGNISVP